VSYSQQVKDELCGVKLHCKSCPKALLYGMLLFGRGPVGQEDGSRALLSTENKRTADLFAQTSVDLIGVIATVLAFRRENHTLYTVALEDDRDVEALFSLYHFDGEPDRSGIAPALVERECCAMSFLRGGYLAGGTMSDPQREYHLEFSTPEASLRDDLVDLMADYDLSFRRSSRGKLALAYTKESNQIEDFLARAGAVRSSMELMNLKIEKELRNRANRITNCETANIDKTVAASLAQIEKIKRLRDEMGLEKLPPALREAAELRLANPDASLRELCALSGGKLSRSGLNHRLQKLLSMADPKD